MIFLILSPKKETVGESGNKKGKDWQNASVPLKHVELQESVQQPVI